jgi:hypothetical protein
VSLRRERIVYLLLNGRDIWMQVVNNRANFVNLAFHAPGCVFLLLRAVH